MTKLRITHSVREEIINIGLLSSPLSRFSDDTQQKLLEKNTSHLKKLKPQIPTIYTIRYKGRHFFLHKQISQKDNLILYSVIEITSKPYSTIWRGHELHGELLDRNFKGTLIKKASKDKNPTFFRQRLLPKAKRLFLENHHILAHLNTKLNFYDARTIQFNKRTYDIIIFTTTNHIYASIFEPIDFQYYYRGKLELDDSFMRQFIKPRRK